MRTCTADILADSTLVSTYHPEHIPHQLVTNVTHDLNNALMVIRGFAGILQTAEAEGSPGRKYTERIIEACDKTESMSDKLLEAAGEGDYEFTQVDLGSLVREIQAKTSSDIRSGIELSIDPSPEPISIQADPYALSAAIYRLIENALTAMPDGGELRISALPATLADDLDEDQPPPGDYVVIGIQDSGSGVAEETFPHIFEPFFTTGAKGVGKGLGLTAAGGVVSGMGGYLVCASTPGAGTAMLICLPAAPGGNS